jgi:hypothetical protein
MGKRIFVSALALFFVIGLLSACLGTPVVKVPAEIVVNKLEVTPNEVGAGETVTVKADISNIGGLSENYTAILNIDGKERDRQTVYINPAENKTVSFAVKELNIGQHEIAIGSSDNSPNVNLTVLPDKILTLQHDNNVCSYVWMMNDPWGQWIRFDAPTTPFEVGKITIKGMRSNYPMSGNNIYTIKIWEGNFKKQLFSCDYPYTNFSPQGNMVDHDINPPITVKGTFIVEFISHSEWNDRTNTSKDTRINICTDSTVASRENIGISYLGGNQEDTYQRQIQMEPRFSHATWIIRVEGVGNKAVSATPPTTPTPPVIPPATLQTPIVPPPTAEKVTTFNAVKYTDPTYQFSIAYPIAWTPTPTTLKGGVFYAKGSGNDRVIIAVRPATNFREAASTYLDDLITAVGGQLVPSIDSETAITLADGTKAELILASAAFGQAKVAITGVLKDGNAIMICGASDPKNLELYKEIGATLVIQTTTPNMAITQTGDNKTTQVVPTATDQATQVVPIVDTQPTPLQGIPVTLRYDHLNSEENLFTQVAVWHTIANFSTPNWGIAGKFVESPLIILPRKEGTVCITGDGSGGYKYLQIGTTYYRDTVDEKTELSKPGWGLATTFHPEKTPFAIRSIKIAGVANYTQGILDDYDKKYVVINILNDKSEVIWSKYYKWSEFRSTDTSSQLPQAIWKEIPVGVTVEGDFTVDILALSYTYATAGNQYNYFAVAYEKLGKCGDVSTNSFISGNGKRYTPYIRLYDQSGSPVCFNLCIRVDGSY